MISNLRTTERNSRIELLRIICMLMIVTYHYAIYGFYSQDLVYSPNKSFVELLSLGGQFGVSVFVLISGYYMVDQKYSFRKFSVFLGQLWFYTLGSLLLFSTVFSSSGLVTREILSMSLLPISKGHYWFATSYFVLMLLSPYLNCFIKNAGRRQLLAAIAVLLLVYTLLPTLFDIYLSNGSTIARFITLYLSAGYIRLYGREEGSGCRVHRRIFLCLLALSFAWVLLSNFLWQRFGLEFFLLHSNDLPQNGIFIYILPLEMFLCFLSFKPVYNRKINFLASLAFGVYLFHDNQLIRSMWQGLFKTSQFALSPWLPVHALAAIVSVYLAGSLVELFRQKTFGRLWQRLTDSILVPLWQRLCRCFTSALRIQDAVEKNK